MNNTNSSEGISGDDENDWANYVAGITWSTSNSYLEAAIFRADYGVRTAFTQSFIPRTVCLGPLNRRISHLGSWEKPKLFYLKKFLVRNPEGGVRSLAMGLYQPLRDLVRGMEYRARCVYNMDESGVSPVSPEEFTRMLLVDSCFVLQLLLEEYAEVKNWNKKKKHEEEQDNYAIKNLTPWALPRIFRDMFLLENQLLLVVLRIILEFALESGLIDDDVRPSMGDLAHCLFRNFALSSGVSKETVNCCIKKGNIHHLLHLFCACLIPSTADHRLTVEREIRPDPAIFRQKDRLLPPDIPKVQSLLWARVKLRKKTEAACFLDISFQGRTLEIPQIKINVDTQTLLGNLIAFEMGYDGAGTNVSAYIWFMRSIMQFEGDVAILREREIIMTILKDEEVREFFDNMFTYSRSIENIYRTCYLRPVAEHIMSDYKNKWNTCLAWWINTWKERFLSSPWQCIGLMAAIGIFVLSAIQTVCTVLDYAKGKNI